MACQMARYINLGSQPIRFGIGTSPGLPWTRYDSAPGGVVEGPEGYLRAFTDAGYTLVTPELQTMLDQNAAKVAAPKVEPAIAPPLEVKIERQETAAHDPDQVTLDVVEPDAPVEPEAPREQDMEAPAQPVAHDPARGRRRGRNQ